jgi:thioredoxin 1
VTRTAKAGVVVALLLGVVGVLAAKRTGSASESGGATALAATRQLPRLVDVGADKCIPCKAMAPILEQLRADYTGRLEVTFVDVWKASQLAEPYGVRIIPTQIFFGEDGRELARHQGFMSRDEILAQWKALGVEL